LRDDQFRQLQVHFVRLVHAQLAYTRPCSATCQTAYINSVEDFCLWGPPAPNSSVADDEEIMVAYCKAALVRKAVVCVGMLTLRRHPTTRDEEYSRGCYHWRTHGRDSRLVSIAGSSPLGCSLNSDLSSFNSVQITGVGDLTKLDLATGDQGGELDPHGATGNGNPVGGLGTYPLPTPRPCR
jgi:hypothetical protein